MLMRPTVVAATGALLGMSALVLSAGPAGAASQQREKRPHSPQIIAHRGGSAYAPENTLAAVDKAHKLGFKWVETDVQRTKDGQLVVMHDTTLNRTTNVENVFPNRSPWKVSDFTYKEISKLDAGSWFSDRYKGTKVPTLEQYLRNLDKTGQDLLLELKAPELYPGLTLQTLTELGSEGWLDQRHLRDKLVVQSFNVDAVKAAHTLNPAVKTAFLGNPPVSQLKSYASFTDGINPSHTAATRNYVDAVHALKGPHGKRMNVSAWTVDDAATTRSVVANGVDGIISNDPKLVRSVTGG
jgi:glycerophosphoryl diester phosphodiesterase